MDSPARALTSASNVYRRKLCPGSAWAEWGLPETTSPHAAEGVLLHHKDAHPEESRDDLSEPQRSALDRNQRLRERFIQEVTASLQIPETARPVDFVEQEFWLCDQRGNPIEPEFPGHPDRVIYYPQHAAAIIFDSKFGRIEVPHASINMQLRTYAVMFAENVHCERIFAAISQPWIAAPDNFHAVEYTADQIPLCKAEILAVLEASRDPQAPRRASIEACAYCKAKALCKPALKVAADLAAREMGEVSVEELEGMAEEIALAKKVIEEWEKRMKRHAAKDELRRFTLGRESESRSLINPQEAMSVLSELGLLSRADFWDCCSASVSKLEAKVREKHGLSEEEAGTRLQMALSGLFQRTPKAPQLVRKRDGRA